MKEKYEVLNYKEVFDQGIINIGNLSRMKRVMDQALSGKTTKVAFIGGSITAGAAASSPETCYAYQVFRWWADQFPDSKVEYLNAGVGATTSQFGVARAEEDVLSWEPDVIFAEFSVNDDDNEFYKETFEGLIRKILVSKMEPALLMFNNVFYDDGRNAQMVHNQVGKYYDLPIVSMKESIYQLVERGIFTSEDISVDYLHPNDFGHELIAGVINHLLDRIYDTVMLEPEDSHYLIPAKPLTANRYFKSMRGNNRNTFPVLEGFQKDETVKNGVWDVFRDGWSAKTKESRIRFEAEGTMISVLYRKYAVHPAPIAKVIMDGDEEHAVILDANFDETWGDKLYLQDITVNARAGIHTIEVVLKQAVPDKEFYLAGIITA